METDFEEDILVERVLNQETVLRTFADQRQRIADLEEQLDASGEFVAELPRLQHQKDEAQAQVRLLQAANEELEKQLRHERGHVDRVHGSPEVLAEKIETLESERQAQSLEIQNLQSQLRAREEELAQLKDVTARLPALESALQRLSLRMLKQTETVVTGEPRF